VTYIIALPCVDLLDKSCIEECPVDCIYEGERMLYIHPDECVDCGACEPVCPVEAIFYEDDVPDQWKDFYKANVEFFEDGGPSAPGAGKLRPATRLPAFPWDRLGPYREKAAAHPGGIVDLSIGTPVDPVPPRVRAALTAAADSPGYPQTAGTPQLREAAARWLARRHGVSVDPGAVLPVIGTKEIIASLPALLGCGTGDTVVYPELAYPTYEIGARLAGARAVAADGLASLGPERVRLVWVNSPANPTGRVLPAAHLRKMADWARERDAVLASDECYLDLAWDAEPVSVLHPGVSGGSAHGLLAVYSLSKRSNLAGYRAGFLTGDPALVAELLEVRRHAGLMMPAPVQAAMVAALDDDTDAEQQRARYAARRVRLRAALEQAGWLIEHSEAGLYLWATRPGADCWASVEALAGAGILVAPGEFYGPAGRSHIRVALTATDERVDAAAGRLARLG
jgi:succinyldiaminopimelate transaminase